MHSPAPKQRLLTFRSGGWVLLLSAVCTLTVSAWLLVPILKTRGRPAIGDGKNLDTYRFNLESLAVPRSALTPAVAKDMIRALGPSNLEFATTAEVPNVRQGQRKKFLVDSDRVLGVTLGNQSRAYPLRVLALHEVVNDTLADTPIAVTYAPLTDSPAVFDRRIANTSPTTPRDFGVSGLVLNSNLVLYDRNPNPSDESLWSQLLARPIAGKAATQKLTLARIPFALCDYATWRNAHPDTLVFLGDPVYRNAPLYAKEPYQSYFATDTLKFPASPLWPHPKPAKKTPVALTPRPDGTYNIAPLSSIPLDATPRDRLYAFLFAAYAFHPTADYSRLTPNP